jgi:hypothetical protein
MAMRTVNTSETIQTYTLELPEEFKIAPKYMVALPSGYTCRIYLTEVEVRDPDNSARYIKVPGWRCMIFNKRGTQPIRGYDRREGDRCFTEALNVRLFIEGWANEVAKKSKTEKIEEDFE